MPPLLTGCQDRQALMEAYGISHIHCFPTTKEVMSTPWQDFLELLQYDMLYGNSGGYPSYASAAAIILFIIVLTITCINLMVRKKHVYNG